MALRVSDVARVAEVSPDTVRFYEREGLLPEAPRSPSGYRAYDESIVERLRFIKGAKEMGLRLGEIRELLEIQDQGACPCGHTKELVARRMAEIDAEMNKLSELRDALAEMAALDCPTTSESRLWGCSAEFPRRGGER